MAYVYRHIRLDKNEPFYIGIGSDDNFKRARAKYGRPKYWQNIASKGYDVEILLNGLTWEQACEKEKEFIGLYGRKDLQTGILVNATNGGDGSPGTIVSDVTRKRQSESRKGIKFSVEHKMKIAEANRRRKGEKRSIEAIEKIRLRNTGRKHSLDTRIKMSKSRTGYKVTEDTKQKLSKSHKGKNISDQHKRNIGKAQKGRLLNEKHHNFKGVVEVYKDLILIGKYMGGNDCARSLSIPNSGVKRCLLGKQKMFMGYTFKRIPHGKS